MGKVEDWVSFITKSCNASLKQFLALKIPGKDKAEGK